MTEEPNLLLTAGALLLGGLVVWLAATAIERRRSRGELELLEGELERSQRDLARSKRHVEILNDFLRSYPQLSRRLHSRGSPRELTDSLLRILDGLFEPEQALVAMRRGGSPGGEDGPLLRITGVLRGGVPRVGDPVAGDGELGLVAESKRVMTREDFDRLPKWQAADLRKQQGFAIDAAAPLLIDDELAGLVAIRVPKQRGAYARELLGAIAELAARSAYSTSTFNRMKVQAERDPLTATLNKASVLRSLSQEIVERLEHQDPLSVFLFDIDHFKSYNDANGHLAGDHLLRELATLVSENIRLEDVFGRFGGEEFLLVMPFTDGRGALVAAEKLRALIASHPFAHRESQPLERITISGGVAAFPEHGSSSTELVRMADEALYRAKNSGRNRVLSAAAVELA